MNSFTDSFTINGITLTAQPICRQDEVLTPDALAFVANLHRATADRRQELLQARRTRRGGPGAPTLPAARIPDSCGRPRASATTRPGGLLRRRPDWRTGAWKSPDPWTRK
jgi:hypothetical protein